MNKDITIKEVRMTEDVIKRQQQIMFKASFLQRLKFLIFGNKSKFIITYETLR